MPVINQNDLSYGTRNEFEEKRTIRLHIRVGCLW